MQTVLKTFHNLTAKSYPKMNVNYYSHKSIKIGNGINFAEYVLLVTANYSVMFPYILTQFSLQLRIKQYPFVDFKCYNSVLEKHHIKLHSMIIFRFPNSVTIV